MEGKSSVIENIPVIESFLTILTILGTILNLYFLVGLMLMLVEWNKHRKFHPRKLGMSVIFPELLM